MGRTALNQVATVQDVLHGQGRPEWLTERRIGGTLGSCRLSTGSGSDKNVPMSLNGHNGDGDTGHDPPPGHIDLRLERCEQCGDVVVKAMTLGVNPPVGIRWTYRNTVGCPVEDHLVVDLLQTHRQPPSGTGVSSTSAGWYCR